MGLIVAGLDPSGGAGILLDTKVFQYFKVPSAGVITANTVQNSCGAKYWKPVEENLFKDQLEFLKEDFTFGVIKTGMVARRRFLEIVAQTFERIPLIVDPVMFSKNGVSLIDDWKVYLDLAEEIFLITPNLLEAQTLAGLQTEDAEKLLISLKRRGFKNILLKGGHLKGERVRDYLLLENGEFYIFSRPRLTVQPRGTGCALSSAIAANFLTLKNLKEAALRAEEFIKNLLKTAQKLGKCHEIFEIYPS